MSSNFILLRILNIEERKEFNWLFFSESQVRAKQYCLFVFPKHKLRKKRMTSYVDVLGLIYVQSAG